MSRSRAPAHQNATAFRHNPNSRKTAAIARIPNEGLCQRCHDVIEWRKRYRKYKPLQQPRHCNGCQLRNVRFAYHTLCTACSAQRKVCPKCAQPRELVAQSAQPTISTHCAPIAPSKPLCSPSAVPAVCAPSLMSAV